MMTKSNQKERSMLFSAPMVRALLDGSKTQTRRILKPQPPAECGIHYMLGNESWLDEKDRAPLRHHWEAWGGPLYKNRPAGHLAGTHTVKHPYGVPGNSLWVRETFIAFGRWETRYSEKKKRDEWHFIDMTLECDRVYQYSADNPDVPLAKGRSSLPGWWTRPAIFMPRVASRILLEIVSVRVERLNDISEDDARAEGITDGGCTNCGEPEPCGCIDPKPDARDAYCHLWGQINGADSWAANPFVWCLTFKRVQ